MGDFGNTIISGLKEDELDHLQVMGISHPFNID